MDWHVPEDLVSTAIQHVGQAAAERIIEVITPDPMMLVHVDGLLVELVITNLLDNAIKASSADSTITIEISFAPDQMKITVRDEGCGIDSSIEDTLFEKFVRGPDAASGGVGLGLAICRAIANAHGGSISAANRSDQPGAEFTVELHCPVCDPEEVNADLESSSLIEGVQ